MHMPLGTMRRIGGKSPSQVIVLDFRMETTITPTALVSLVALFQTTPKRCTEPVLTKKCKKGISRL